MQSSARNAWPLNWTTGKNLLHRLSDAENEAAAPSPWRTSFWVSGWGCGWLLRACWAAVTAVWLTFGEG